MSTIPKVILLIESSTAYGRGLLQGIAKYTKLHSQWQIYREPPFYIDFKGAGPKKTRLLKWGATGMFIREPHRHKDMIDMGIPTILSPNIIEGYPAIVTDYLMIGAMAAEHLLERHFQHYAYCGYDDMLWSRNRARGFAQRLAEADYQPILYKQPKSRTLRAWENEQPFLAEWLRILPKPVGIMACNDDRGQNIIETCNIIGLSIPEEVAVIGVDNDELVCNLTNPTLSSIALSSPKSGFEGARLLDRLMAGEKMNHQVIHDRPTHIVTRQSTDSHMIADKEVAQAMRFIIQHARDNIQVNDVTNALAVSRRNLSRKFKAALGSPIHNKIKQVRIEEITRLLVETNLTVSQIAHQLGFQGIKHIARYYRKEKGMTPLEYRKQHC